MSSTEKKRGYEDQREAQIAVKAAFLREFIPTYDLLDMDRIDESAIPWVQEAMNVIRPYRQQSADIAAEHYAAARRLHVPPSKASIPAPNVTYVNTRGIELPVARRTRDKRLVDELERRRTLKERRAAGGNFNIDWADYDRAAERSLLVTGPGELKSQIKKGRTERRGRAEGLKKAAGAASRHVLAGGRETTLQLVEADRAAIGWARVTDGDPCAFCALLSSRGPVYKTEQAAAFQPHDGCGCIPVAVWTKADPWPGRSREFRRMYNQNIMGQFSGKELLNAWRRYYEQQQTGRKPRQFRDRSRVSA